MTYTVYKHTSPNSKVYIGITSMNPSKRWNSGRGYRTQPYFYRAIQKYGWDSFDHEIICDGLSKEDACNMEIKLIEFYKSNNPRYGYNTQIGGETGNLGVKASVETRKKMSESHKGQKVPEEHRLKLSKLFQGEGNPMYGKHQSEETRRKMSESHKGERCNLYGKPSSRRKSLMCVETGIVYESTYSASKSNNICESAISMACNGKRKTAGGYHWRYINDDNQN